MTCRVKTCFIVDFEMYLRNSKVSGYLGEQRGEGSGGAWAGGAML